MYPGVFGRRIADVKVACAGKSDFVDALICATDIVYRALNDRPQLEAAVVKKRIVLVTNFLDAVGLSAVKGDI